MDVFFGFLIACECNCVQLKVDNTGSGGGSDPGCYLIGAGEPRAPPPSPPPSTLHLQRGGLMMVSPALRSLSSPPFLFFCCLLLLQLPICRSIYCDEDDCYDLLGVSQSANASEIKKAYYKLSLKHHPDKNPDPESRKLFVKIANAYEILKDEATREQYDYAIAHPEEVFYNTARYYHAYYGHKTDPRAVLVGLLLVVSALQYLNQWTRYTQAVTMVKKTPAYKNRLKALELERSGGVTNKKKGLKQIDKNVEEKLSNELELHIQGAEKPSLWNLIGVQFVLLPYTLGKLLIWQSCWFWRYQIKKLPYSWDDACYLTRSCLKITSDAWRNIDESTKSNLVQKRLWVKRNMDSYVAEMRKESKRRR
ncbi:DnaJ domain [Musa troglodytarum]|uniref:DnaJ domain n=1 Tax=Musa troglodytarum TaxID=320322 RepID=A0A9E7JKB9_9LILI|nr:DnaJ domain [Musa troglodytarum]URD83899.1 DnaJ domain [Musa troglodytarum]